MRPGSVPGFFAARKLLNLLSRARERAVVFGEQYISSWMNPRHQNLILALAFLLAIAATIFFGMRAGRKARRVHFKNEQIRGWMRVPFKTRSSAPSE